MFTVIASAPRGEKAQPYWEREIGPFESRRIAEDAAARLVDDPARYGKIEILEAGAARAEGR